MKTKKIMVSRVTRLLIVFAVLPFGSSAFSKTVVSNASTEWFATGTWNETFVANDTARIGSHAITLGGDATVNAFWVGNGADSVGSLTINSGGALTIGGTTQTDIGRSGNSQAALTVSMGGEFVSTGVVRLGFSTGSKGTVNVFGGSFSAGSLEIGAYASASSSGSGEFNITGGTASVTGATTVGNNSSGTASLNVNGGVFTTGSLLVANRSGADLTVSTGGRLVSNGETLIGVAVGGTGTFNVNGGSFSTDSLTIANNNGASSLTLTTGTVVVTNATLLGNNTGGTGTLNVKGGSFTTGTLTLGNSNSGTGKLNLTGGSVDAGALLVGSTAASTSGKGEALISGAILTLNGTSGLRIANAGTGSGSVTLEKGGHILITSASSSSYWGASNEETTVSLSLDSTSSIVSAGSINIRKGYEINFISGVDDSFLGITANSLTISGTGAEDAKIFVDLAAFAKKFVGTLDITLITLDEVFTGTLAGEFLNDNSEYIDTVAATTGFHWDTDDNGKHVYVLTLTGTVIPEPSTYAVALGISMVLFVIWRRRHR